MNKLLTIVIPSYRSKRLILSHLKNLSKRFKIIIIENSYDKSLEKIIKKKYSNVDIFLKKNLGFGRAVNFAAKKVKTRYFVSINPDTLFYPTTFKNLLRATKLINKFGVIGPILINSKQKYKKDLFIEKKKIDAPAMLFETKIFKKIKGFDENFFLYFEDNDYFKKCNNLNLKLYLISNSYFKHSIPKKYSKLLNVKSSSFSNLKEKNDNYSVGGWHGQWSKFYYLKKYNGFFKALIMCLPNIILNIIQLLIYIFINPAKAKYKYYKIEGFFCSCFGIRSFKRSKFDKEHIY